MSSSAIASDAPLYTAQCSGVRLHGRRGGDSAAALTPIAASGNGAPAAALGVHVGIGCDEQPDDSAIAEARRPVQRGEAIAVHGGAGVRGWAPRGHPSTQPVPETQNSRLAPRVDYGFRFG